MNKEIKRPVESVETVAHRIAKDLQELKDNIYYHFDMVNVLDKKISVVSHNLEIIAEMEDGKEKEKIKKQLHDEQDTLNEQRRWHKNQYNLIANLSKPIETDEKGRLNMKHLINIFSGVTETHKKYKLINYNEDNGIYKEEDMEEDLTVQMDRLKKGYESVIVDKYNNKVIAFNKSTTGRKFYEQGVYNNDTCNRANIENRKSLT